MPYMKFISGHTKSVGYVARYLTHDGRSLGETFVNLVERSLGNVFWPARMDQTREELGCNKKPPRGKLRTYEHIIISLDKADSEKVTLPEFEDFVTDYVEHWFGEQGVLGSFQVAVVFHDDNEGHLLHAHLVVNNAELTGAGRVSTKMTDKAVDLMYADLNARALNAGWHGYTKDGQSMTLEEMRAVGAEPSVARRTQPERARAYVDPVEKPGEVPGETPFEGAEEVDIPEPPHGSPFQEEPIRFTKAEQEHERREGWSWKEDLRQRIEVAALTAETADEFKEALGGLGVGVSFNAKGEIKYSHPSAPETRQVLGTTLGRAYGNQGVARAIAGTGSGKRLRRSIISDLATVKAGTKSGSQAYDDLLDFMDYNERHHIRTYSDYPDTPEGRLMRRMAEGLTAFGPLHTEEFHGNVVPVTKRPGGGGEENRAQTHGTHEQTKER